MTQDPTDSGRNKLDPGSSLAKYVTDRTSMSAYLTPDPRRATFVRYDTRLQVSGDQGSRAPLQGIHKCFLIVAPIGFAYHPPAEAELSSANSFN